ncbi:MAG: cytochrome c oxidase subunit II [Actinobacteria bacterium]|nr:MAG: cytochrome c oxidase subunit II [Actinomycetota bacterium]
MAGRTDDNGSRWVRWARPSRAGLVALAVVVLAGCGGDRFALPNPASEEAGHTLGLWRGFLFTAAFVGALVLGLITFVLIRFRRRSNEIPGQADANIPLEIVYTVTPIVVVMVLFAFSMFVERKVTHEVAQPDLVVNVTGFQWGWQFEYPEQHITINGTGIANPPQLVLPVGRTSRLVLRTQDVNHSFWVPPLLVKRDLIAGVDNAIDVTPTRVGTFDGRCAEYCSLDHWRMIFVLRVVPADQFDQALADAERVAAGR